MIFRKKTVCQSYCLALLLILLATTTVRAGGGPENLFLVVNANSDSSKTIANHYIRLRNVPASNVFYVDWKGGTASTSAALLREKLLLPIVKEIEARQLALQIDYVVYSSDFPWRINLKGDYPPGVTFDKQLSPIASLTGATYLWQYVLKKSPAIVTLDTNWYVPGDRKANMLKCQAMASLPTRGFRGRYLWTDKGQRGNNPKTDQRYFLSTMLGVTSGRGNSVDEVIKYLRGAAFADNSPPEGTFYFMKHGGPRSKPRHDCFDAVMTQLRTLGAKVELQKGRFPKNLAAVNGLTFGTPKYDIVGSNVAMLPGSIGDNLTSASGVLSNAGKQTALTDLLRAGAAGASGTVVEPYAIQGKFPLPSLMLHYRRGCSLAEAYYQSVSAPYQLLIVGDPLCQPWARRPGLKVEGLESGQKVKEKIDALPKITPPVGQMIQKTSTYDVFVDGRLRARLPAGKNLRMDTSQVPEGHHELRIVANSVDVIESQANWIASLDFDNEPGPAVELTSLTGTLVTVDQPVTFKAAAPGATGITIRQNFRELGEIEGESGEITLPAKLLGRGPVRLQAIAQMPPKADSKPAKEEKPAKEPVKNEEPKPPEAEQPAAEPANEPPASREKRRVATGETNRASAPLWLSVE